jgi:hypothetical protein
MGVDLSGAGGCKWLSWTGWEKLLKLAHEYGWKPAGTKPPRGIVMKPDGSIDHEMTAMYSWSEEDWDGSYFSNNGQYVTDEDAANIADALERALHDIPDEETEAKVRAVELQPWLAYGSRGPDHDIPLSLIDKFSGRPGKERVKNFMVFCRAGGFCIG